MNEEVSRFLIFFVSISPSKILNQKINLMKIYQIIHIPKGLSPVAECDCQEEYNSGYTEGHKEGFDKGYTSGYTDGSESISCDVFYDSGRTDGWNAGYPSGYTDGANSVDCQDFYDSGVTDGFNSGYTSGYTDGLNVSGASYSSGYTDGFDAGYDSGSTDGWGVGYESGKTDGYDSGFTVGYGSGYTDGLNACSGGSGNEDLIANLQGDYFLIPEGTTHLRDYAFYNCTISPSVSAFTIPDSVTSIGYTAFGNFKGANTVIIPDSVVSIGTRGFNNSNLSHVVLGSGLTALPTGCFGGSSLVDITIPSNITAISGDCFNPVRNMTAMTFESTTPATLTGNTPLGTSALTFPIFVPCEAVDTYKTAWPYYADRITCGSSEKPRRIVMELDNPLVISGQSSFTTEPADAYLVTPTYYSEDETIATVDSAGTVTVVSEGTVRIHARFKYGNNQNLDASKEIQTRLTPVPPVPSGVSVLEVAYVTTGTDQEVILFGGYRDYAQNENRYFNTFCSAMTKMNVDGVDVQLSESNIKNGYDHEMPSGLSHLLIYTYTFPSAGRHTVKYYISNDYLWPSNTIGDMIFANRENPYYESKIIVEVKADTSYKYLQMYPVQAQTGLTSITLYSTTLVSWDTEFSPFEGCTNLSAIYVPADLVDTYKTTYTRYANIFQPITE